MSIVANFLHVAIGFIRRKKAETDLFSKPGDTETRATGEPLFDGQSSNIAILLSSR